MMEMGNFELDLQLTLILADSCAERRAMTAIIHSSQGDPSHALPIVLGTFNTNRA